MSSKFFPNTPWVFPMDIKAVGSICLITRIISTFSAFLEITISTFWSCLEYYPSPCNNVTPRLISFPIASAIALFSFEKTNI